MKPHLRYDHYRLDTATPQPGPVPGSFVYTAYIARTGIQLYKDQDGNVRRELRADEDVFDPESLHSLGMLPVTELHPEQFVDAVNYTELNRGHTGADVEQVVIPGKGGLVRAHVLVMDADLNEKIQSEEMCELSVGYEAQIEDTPGAVHPQYGPHDTRQRNIRGNHLAVVPHGRANQNWDGPLVGMRTDGQDSSIPVAWATQRYDALPSENLDGAPQPTPPKKKRKKMPQIVIDGVTFDVEDSAVAVAISNQKKDMEQMKKDMASMQGDMETMQGDMEGMQGEHDAKVKALKEQIATLTGELEAMTGQKDMLEKKLEEGPKPGVFDAAMVKQYEERKQLLDMAADLEIEDVDDMKNVDIKRAILEDQNPDFAEDASDAYIEGAWGIMKNQLKDAGDSWRELGEDVERSQKKGRNDGQGAKRKSDAAFYA